VLIYRKYYSSCRQNYFKYCQVSLSPEEEGQYQCSLQLSTCEIGDSDWVVSIVSPGFFSDGTVPYQLEVVTRGEFENNGTQLTV